MLKSMEFSIEFDRPIDKEKHCISPGGYELNGKRFDFCHFEGDVIGNHTLHCYVDDFDTDYGETLRKADLKGDFSEFFVYTGEYDDPEIKPKKIKYIVFGTDNGWIRASGKTLESANRCLLVNGS